MPRTRKARTRTPRPKIARTATKADKPRTKKQARPAPPVDQPGVDGPDDIPAPAQKTVQGPTAQELADHGSQFMTQALLVKARADHPDDPPTGDIMKDDAFQALELMMVLALFGLGEFYAGRLPRLMGTMTALERRVFSEEVLADLTPGSLSDLYKLSVNEANRCAKYITDLLATVNGDATRTKLMAYATRVEQAALPSARPPFKGKKKALPAETPTAETLERPHPSVLLHQIHTAPDPEEDEEDEENGST